jgi:hypothetical protein
MSKTTITTVSVNVKYVSRILYSEVQKQAAQDFTLINELNA